MQLHADFSERILVHGADLPWSASPMPGVARRMLERVGGEVARATSIVRYDAGSRFSPHTHGGGEEFIVLEGVFQDEHGDYPAGTYVRNPPGSAHTPRSEPGCVLFVKLWQFAPGDDVQLSLAMDREPGAAGSSENAVALFSNATETVTLNRLASGARLSRHLPGGGEVLVLAGSAAEHDALLRPLSWLRVPPGESLELAAGDDGVQFWMKTDHLTAAPEQVRRVLAAAGA